MHAMQVLLFPAMKPEDLGVTKPAINRPAIDGELAAGMEAVSVDLDGRH